MLFSFLELESIFKILCLKIGSLQITYFCKQRSLRTVSGRNNLIKKQHKVTSSADWLADGTTLNPNGP